MQKISYQKFEQLAEELKQHHFFHSIDWTQARQEMGWKCEYLGLFENEQLIAGCVVHLKSLPKIGYKMLYIPKGMVINYENKEHLNLFTKAITKYAKDNKVYVVKIDPEIKRYDIDLEGNPLSEQTPVVENIKDAGFKHLGFFNNFEGINSRHTFVLHYNNRDEDELFSLLKNTDRSKIKKSKELGVYLEEGTIDDLDEFMKIMEITALRGGYQIRTKEFFEIIMKNFNSQTLKLVFSKINLKDYSKILDDNIKALEGSLNEVKKQLDYEDVSNKQKRKLNNQINEYNKQINKFKNDIDYAKEMHKKYGQDDITLSTSFYTYYYDRVYYWYSGSNTDFRNLRAVKVQMWDIIKDSVNQGYNSIDFMGTSGILDPQDKNYGLYEFKKSFGGDWEEYIGEFDLIINPIVYKIASKIIPKLQTSQNNFLVKALKKVTK